MMSEIDKRRALVGLRQKSMYDNRSSCIVCGCRGSHVGYTIIPFNCHCHLVSVCNMKCLRKWAASNSGEKGQLHYDRGWNLDKTLGVKDMKVYTGKVKDGKIAVAEPDGTDAVLIFDTVSTVKYQMDVESKIEPEVVESVAEVRKVPKEIKGKVAKVGKRMRYHEGRNNSRIYRTILGMSIGEFGRRLKASGFSGTKNEAVERIRNEFALKGYGGMWSRNKKLKVSVAASLAPFGFPYDRKPPVLKTVKKKDEKVSHKYRPSGLMDAPNSKSAHELWVEVLGEGVDSYIRRTLVGGQTPEAIINSICDSVVAKGYKPNRNSIGALVYIKAKQVS